MKVYFNSIIASVGTLVVYLFGGVDTVLKILFLFMFLDLLTGFMASGIEHILSSKQGFLGIKKKVTMLIYMIIGVMLDRLIGNEQTIFRTLISFYLVANEGLSILENGARMGVPFPQKIVDTLIQLKEGK